MKTKHIFKPALLSLAVTSAMYSGHALSQENNSASEPDVEVIAVKELSDSKINLSREIINFLVKQANGDRNNLRSELDKIKLFYCYS
mgnify:CR=1 FL=1